MLELFFSFSGRVGRARYVTTLTINTIAAAFVVMAGATSVPWSHLTGRHVIALLGVLLLLVIGLIWSNLSLQARRIRDIGWNPKFVLPGFIVFQVAALVSAGFAVKTGNHQHLMLGPMGSMAYSFVLFFWPSLDKSEERAARVADVFGSQHDPVLAATLARMGAHTSPSAGFSPGFATGSQWTSESLSLIPAVPTRMAPASVQEAYFARPRETPARSFGRRGLA